ncbi:DUF4199 domain-containing protein [Limibacter armeniacum]|uniref:DUF4199 domain-containing protein n=1 Tax=Limibacter armeniacum TaxID=466084 RepID=UPI002FE5FA36
MSDNKIEWKHGLLMAFCLICYFLGMKWAGFFERMELRIFNFIIHLIYVLKAVREYRKKYPEHFNYFNGFIVGILTTAIGVLCFAFFLFIYFNLQPDDMSQLREKASHGSYLTPLSLSIIIVMEGLGTGIVISYIVMRYVGRLKKRKVLVTK